MPALSFSGITTLGPFWKLIPEGLKEWRSTEKEDEEQ